MPRHNLLDTRTVNYLELIGNGRRHRVPPYQRDYSWTEEQWEDLWNDIERLQADPDERHYLGSLVVEGVSDREFQVIDGQQRLATLSLFALAAIARLLSLAEEGVAPEENAKRAAELRNRYLGEKDPASLLESSRLNLNEVDDPFYQDYLIQLQSPPNLRRLPRSNQLLWNCFRFYAERLEQAAALQQDGEAVARLLSETVARQLLFILITVDDELSAYTVFETLNARGMALTTTDLLKNYLFSRIPVGTDRTALQRRWQELVGTVGQTRFPRFLRYHMLCRERGVRERQLFKVVRAQVRERADVFALLDTLSLRAELFAAVLDPNHEYWTELREARPHVLELNLFRAQQPMPLLFEAWERFEKADFVRVLKLVSVISFRYTVVSGLNPNALELAYHQAAKAVADGEAATVGAVFERLRTVYVDDEKMLQDFSLLAMSAGTRKRLVKYILARLEQDYSGRDCDWDAAAVTIEHILPENPAESWAENYEEQRWDADIDRLGNLTLLEASANRDLANGPYADKLAAYGQSRYQMTRELQALAPAEWTPDLLAKRQQELARRAVRIWRSDFA